MLKGIPNILSPELLKILMEMGHSDELVIVDGNFPKLGHAKNVVRADGHGVPEILEAVMKYFPLDTFVDNPTAVMAVTKGDPYVPEIWAEYLDIIAKNEPHVKEIKQIDRFDFYERAAKAYATVTTSEAALYANIILTKGVIIS